MKISVAICAYNAERTLARTIESVIKQTYTDYEVVIVNDGSTDGSVKVIQKFIRKYNEKIVLIEKENGGLSLARNIGIQKATGEYVTFLDSDDYISTDYLKVLYNTAKKYNSDMVASGQYKVKENGEIIDSIFYKPDQYGNCNLRRLNISGKIYRKDYLNKYGIYFPVGKTYEDNPFNMAAYFLAKNLRFLEYAGYFQVVHEGSITSKKIKYENLPLEAIENSIKLVKKNSGNVVDMQLFDFTVMSFLTYFIFIRNKKKEYLATRNRKSDTEVVLKVCDYSSKIVNKYFKDYLKNEYCKILKNNNLLFKQKLGVKIFCFLIKTKMLNVFTTFYYKI